uniref:CHK kinase-like domain-containing protein n=2 Tax=Branchiostoma floridae TaxID=7739 RepID=C3XRH6_BRAFL|eukprot:XP_002613285.1 hypothetical protein BRAFLDRAFT_68250 [Branchiostoma floridae]
MATPEKITVPQSTEDIAPSWVQQVLQRDLPDVTITDVDVKGSISEGDGYLSDIIPFDAVGTSNSASQHYSLVAKLTDFNRPQTLIPDFPKEFHIQMEKMEVKFYSILAPDLLNVSVQSEPKSQPKATNDGDQAHAESLFLPKCYFAATDPSSMVSVRVMENLKSQGFSIKPNRQTLSRDEMLLTVGAFAQAHGLSHRLELRLGKPLPEKYDWIQPLDAVLNEAGLKAFMNEYEKCLKKFATAFPDQVDLVARLEKLQENSMKFLDVSKSPRIKVLSHGDCWVNNIMIKYEGDVPVAVKLVDWQAIKLSPPTYDLAQLFLCCMGWDVFHNHRDAILEHYHQQLQKTLGPGESSGLRSYTLEQLKADFRADCRYGVFCRVMGLVILPADQDLLKMLQEIQEWGVL